MSGICVGPDKHWHSFKGNLEETAERHGRLVMGLSEGYTVLSTNWKNRYSLDTITQLRHWCSAGLNWSKKGVCWAVVKALSLIHMCNIWIYVISHVRMACQPSWMAKMFTLNITEPYGLKLSWVTFTFFKCRRVTRKHKLLQSFRWNFEWSSRNMWLNVWREWSIWAYTFLFNG